MTSGDLGTVHLRRAGSHLVAAVFALQGATVSWPLEPATYDLLVESAAGGPLLRVQVKTCTTRRDGAWTCWITRNEYAPGPAGKRRARYPPDALDVLAVVDGDGGVYLIPFHTVAGQATVTLRAYERYRAARLSLCGPAAEG